MKHIASLAFFLIQVLNPVSLYAKQELPDNSIYHLDSQWQDQTGTTFALAELAGPIRLLAFVYTYCEHTCPVIVSRIENIVAALPQHARQNLVVTLVTLDPQRDTVERVNAYLKNRGLENKPWQILVGSETNVLLLSSLFDVRYKPMGESDFAHSNVITLLDQKGEIKYQVRGLDQSTDPLIEKLIKLAEVSKN